MKSIRDFPLTEKLLIFSVRKTMPKDSQSTDAKIRRRIYGNKRGWVFTPKRFQDLGSSDAIDSTLRRLKADGAIRQLARGLYDYPAEHPKLGLLAPSVDAVARALKVRDAVKLQPSGAYAANLLGLSEQVPMKVVFLTDGPSRRVSVSGREIVLKRTTPRNMATAGRISGTVAQALRWLGKNNVDGAVIARLRNRLSDDDKAQLLKDLRHVPAWVADAFREIATAEPA